MFVLPVVIDRAVHVPLFFGVGITLLVGWVMFHFVLAVFFLLFIHFAGAVFFPGLLHIVLLHFGLILVLRLFLLCIVLRVGRIDVCQYAYGRYQDQLFHIVKVLAVFNNNVALDVPVDFRAKNMPGKGPVQDQCFVGKGGKSAGESGAGTVAVYPQLRNAPIITRLLA